MALTPGQQVAVRNPNFGKWIAGLVARQPKLPATAATAFAQARTNAIQQYGQQSAQNRYDRASAVGQFGQQQHSLGVQFGNDRASLLEQLRQQRIGVQYGYTGRGLLGSGIQQQGIQDWQTGATMRQRTMAQNQALQYGNLAQTRSRTLGRYDLAAQQIEQRRRTALAQIEQQRLAAIQQLVAQHAGAY
jgi:hypothetical protein